MTKRQQISWVADKLREEISTAAAKEEMGHPDGWEQQTLEAIAISVISFWEEIRRDYCECPSCTANREKLEAVHANHTNS